MQKYDRESWFAIIFGMTFMVCGVAAIIFGSILPFIDFLENEKWLNVRSRASAIAALAIGTLMTLLGLGLAIGGYRALKRSHETLSPPREKPANIVTRDTKTANTLHTLDDNYIFLFFTLFFLSLIMAFFY